MGLEWRKSSAWVEKYKSRPENDIENLNGENLASKNSSKFEKIQQILGWVSHDVWRRLFAGFVNKVPKYWNFSAYFALLSSCYTRFKTRNDTTAKFIILTTCFLLAVPIAQTIIVAQTLQYDDDDCKRVSIFIENFEERA